MIDLHATAIAKVEHDVTVTRRNQTGTYDQDGFWRQEVSPLEWCCKASVQRVTGRELERLPENERTTERVWVWTKEELLPGGNDQTEPDRVTYLSRVYEIERKDDWQLDGAYFKYRAVRVGQ